MSRIPLCSRSGHTHPLGKLVLMPNVRLPEQVLDRLRELATAEGVPFGELVRVTLETRAFGIEHAESIALAQIRRVAGMDPAANRKLS